MVPEPLAEWEGDHHAPMGPSMPFGWSTPRLPPWVLDRILATCLTAAPGFKSRLELKNAWFKQNFTAKTGIHFLFGFDEKRNLCIRDGVCVCVCVYVCDAPCLHDILRREVVAVLILWMWMPHYERKNPIDFGGGQRSCEVTEVKD